jgi:hypothetical protein
MSPESRISKENERSMSLAEFNRTIPVNKAKNIVLERGKFFC